MKNNNQQQSLYNDLAALYDKLYSYKDYNAEAKAVLEIINTRIKKNNSKITLLDLACGTGKHISYFLKQGLKCDGLDGNPDILKVAQQNNSNAEFYHQDLNQLRLPQKYNVVTCFFSSIQYIVNQHTLRKIFKNIYENLEENGLLIFDLQYAKDRWQEGHVAVNTYRDDEYQILMLFQSWSENNITHWKPAILVKHDGKLDMEIDEHTIHLYTVQEIVNLLKACGFTTEIQNGYSGKKYTMQSQIPLIIAKR